MTLGNAIIKVIKVMFAVTIGALAGSIIWLLFGKKN
jgi:uncharacterized membrane protein YgaE (UPF0421/DUF939 family)